ncbi:hypothetical protein K1719_044952 [Acacia pycnantha]|nr:hypothetical protein K1719_044952 [Acacia pycnantha]
MYHFPKLKQLHLSLEKKSSFTFWERSPNLGELTLSGNFEKALGGGNVATLVARFPKLTLMYISIMGSLSPSLVSSRNLTHLNVKLCEGNTLMTSSIARSLVHLTHLSISYCDQMEEIITKQEGEDDEDKEICFRKLEFLELSYLPRLKRFCGYNYTFKFLLLDQLIIIGCLKFKTFSPGLIETPCLKSVQLGADWEKHEIWDNDLNKTVSLQRFVASKEVVLDEDDAIMIRNDQLQRTIVIGNLERLTWQGKEVEKIRSGQFLMYHFPKLKLLHLSLEEEFGLPYLQFWEKSPILRELKLSGDFEKALGGDNSHSCPGQLESVRVHQFNPHKDIWMTDLNNTIEHLFTFEEVISTCSSMALNPKNITMIKNVFPNDQITDFMSSLYLRRLYIAYMDKLKSIWKDDSQLPSIHQNLNVLQVESCCSLVQLAPSSASFQNLKELYVSRCHQLIHLVTTSTAKSLVSLRRLEINDCKRMEEIVMNDTNEDVQVGITFNQLYSIKLTDMPSLKLFSSQSRNFEFPKFEEIEISGCPEMKKFSPGVLKTPRLSKVKIEEHDKEWKDEEDVNKIMEGVSSAKV